MSKVLFLVVALIAANSAQAQAQELNLIAPVSELSEYLSEVAPDSEEMVGIYSFLVGAASGYVGATTRMLTLLQLEPEFMPDLTECAPDPDTFYDRLLNVEGELAQMPLGAFASVVMIQSCEETVIESLRRRQQSQ